MILTSELLISAYAQGVFPMAHGEEIYWYDPDPRAILPLDAFHVPRKLRRLMKQVVVREADGSQRPFVPAPSHKSAKPGFEIRVNTAFDAVIAACASPDREGGWIDARIMAAYRRLHQQGWAHSVETWRADELVGGLYGVAVRGLFAGESMFSQATDASKVALVYLVERLRTRRFQLLDVQFHTPHLARFGVVEIPQVEYKRRLMAALQIDTTFT